MSLCKILSLLLLFQNINIFYYIKISSINKNIEITRRNINIFYYMKTSSINKNIKITRRNSKNDFYSTPVYPVKRAE